MNFKNIGTKIMDELKKFSNYEDIKQVDKKVVIPCIILLILLVIGYYYFIFAKYDIFNSNTTNNKNKNLNSPKNYANEYQYDETKSDEEAQQKLQSILFKNPSYHMDVASIPKDSSLLHMEIFQNIYNYFSYINNEDYKYAFQLLDNKFITENNISENDFIEFCKSNYYKYNNFFIHSISESDTENSYTVKISVENLKSDTIGYFTYYDLIKKDYSYNFVINDIMKFKNNK